MNVLSALEYPLPSIREVEKAVHTNRPSALYTKHNIYDISFWVHVCLVSYVFEAKSLFGAEVASLASRPASTWRLAPSPAAPARTSSRGATRSPARRSSAASSTSTRRARSICRTGSRCGSAAGALQSHSTTAMTLNAWSKMTNSYFFLIQVESVAWAQHKNYKYVRAFILLHRASSRLYRRRYLQVNTK